MMKRKLPIGIQTFREIREDHCYYVDKTAWMRRLVDGGKHYFLSRPRRFGKSLLIDTLKELFEGKEALFKGLDVHEHWDWSACHPVLRFDFSGGDFKDPAYLHKDVMAQLEAIDERGLVGAGFDAAPLRFRRLIQALHEETGQRAVVLVDEYDKPILDALDTPEVARANRDFLRGLYGIIKSSDAHLRFSFLTGVSKFSKVSLFSDLNNLVDITLDPRYSALCGYTESDLDTVFAPELAGPRPRDHPRVVQRLRVAGRGEGLQPLRHPAAVRQAQVRRVLVRDRHAGVSGRDARQAANQLLALNSMAGSTDLLSTFDVGDIGTEALLFQTGYLTIQGEEDLGGEPFYRLGYPNREVRQSLSRSLLRYLVKDRTRQEANSIRLYRLLEANDFAGLETLFHAFFASIPYEWYTNNDIARYEGYYASVFYSYFAGLGLDITVEDSSSHGRLDMAVRFNGNVYLFEFKVVEMAPEGAAMGQLKDRRYADRYRGRGEPIYLIAVEFSKDTRNVVAFEVERV